MAVALEGAWVVGILAGLLVLSIAFAIENFPRAISGTALEAIRVDVRTLFIIFALGLQATSLGQVPDNREELRPVIVTGKKAQGPNRTEIPSKRIELDSESPATLTEVLQAEPSLQVREAGGKNSSTWISIRGQDPSQTRVFIESVPITDCVYQKSPLELMSPEFFKEIEVFAGGPPVGLLGDGFGGAINLKKGERPSKWRASVKAGSFGYLEGVIGAPAGTTHDLVVQGVRSQENFQYFRNNGTVYETADDGLAARDHNSFWRLTLFPWFEWSTSNHSRLKTFALLNTGQNEIPGSSEQPAVSAVESLYLLAAAIDERRLSPVSDLQSTVYVRVHQERFSGKLPESLWVPERTRALTWGARSTLEFELGSAHHLSLSGGGQSESFSPEWGGSLHPPTQRKIQLPLGAVYRWVWSEAWTLKPSLGLQGHFYFSEPDPRFENLLLARSAGDRSLLAASPRVGIEWKGRRGALEAHAVVGLGRYQRAPSLLELYGSSWGMTPNPELEAETAWKVDWEGQLRWGNPDAPWLQLDYAIYTSRAENLISLVQNSPSTRSAVNVGEALLFGQELGLLARAGNGIYARAWFNWLRAKNLTDSLTQYGRELPYRAHRFRGEIGYQRGWLKGRYVAEWMSGSFLDVSNTASVQPSWEHGVGISLAEKSVGTLSLDIKNIFNQMTVPGSIGQNAVTELASQVSGYPAPGRRLYLSWRYEI